MSKKTSKKSSRKSTKLFKSWTVSRALHSYAFYGLLCCIAIFGVIGNYYVNASNADTGHCIDATFSISEQGTYVPCVEQLQSVLNDWHNEGTYGIYRAGGYQLSPDGFYGPTTQGDVEDFQYWNNQYINHYHVSVNGTVNRATWKAICYDAIASGYQYGDIGCAAERLL